MSRFSLRKRAKSFTYAFTGIRECLFKEHNAWIHCTIAVLVIIFGFIFNITRTEWTLVFLCFGLVIGAEIINTAIEKLVDLVSPIKTGDNGEKVFNPLAKAAKDCGAGAVLVCALASAAVGLLIFVPYIIDFFVK